MGAFRTVSFGVGVFHRVVSPLTISFSITWKLILLLLCLLSTTTTSTTTEKLIMATSECKQVMNDGSDLEGFHILFQTHDIPEFIPLSKVIQVNYNGIIDNMALIDTLFVDTSIKTKLKLSALDNLKAIVADLVLIASNHDPSDQAGIDGRQMFIALPFRWKDYTGLWHRIDSTKDLAKAVQSSMTAPHSSHSFYEKELVLSIPTSGLFCSRTSTPDCKDLSKIFTKAPAPLTKTTAAVLASVSVSGAANAIADRVKAGADASKTVHEVIDLSTAPPEVQK
jgi:hypothetical protein